MATRPYSPTSSYRTFSAFCTHASKARSAENGTRTESDDLFEYSSGRWMYVTHSTGAARSLFPDVDNSYNATRRYAERYRSFKIEELRRVMAECTGQPPNALVSLKKLSEGGLNRIIQATFKDGKEVLARIPYPLVTHKQRLIASEVATLQYLRQKDIPVPKILSYKATLSDNPVGVEYMIYEKIQGTALTKRWYYMTPESRKNIVGQILDLEEVLFASKLPASGSLYYRRDLDNNADCLHVEGIHGSPEEIVLGPIAHSAWYHGDRESLDLDCGPWRTFLDCFVAGANKELQWNKLRARPKLHGTAFVRHLYDMEKIDPKPHAQLLQRFLKVAPYLDVDSDHVLSRPVLRHPDLSPNNIIVSEQDKIVGLIDWQNAAVLPLCLAAGIPKYFDNSGDPPSDHMDEPQAELPENFDSLSPKDQEDAKDMLLKRYTHYAYCIGTMLSIPDHFYAITKYSAGLRRRIYGQACNPWDGDSIALKQTLIEAVQAWPLEDDEAINRVAATRTSDACPISFSEAEIQECEEKAAAMQTELSNLSYVRKLLDIDPQGWVPDTEHLEKSKAMAADIKQEMLEMDDHSQSFKHFLRNHFPFEDHEEE